MTLEQLRIFIAVAEKQHVTQAARELNLTQSATSAAIAALETRYDVKLFDRIGRGIALTQTGRDFLVEARAVLARARAAAQVLNDLAGLKRGSLTIAASQTVANYWLPAGSRPFTRPNPASSFAFPLPIPNRSRAPSMKEAPISDSSKATSTMPRLPSARSAAIRWSWWSE